MKVQITLFLLLQLLVCRSMAITPIAPMEIENQGYWLPAKAVADYVGKTLVFRNKEIIADKYTFKKDESKVVDGITYIKSEVFADAFGGERIYRPDIDRTIIDIPGMPMPLSMQQIGYFPTGEKLYVQSKDTSFQLSVTPWFLYSNSLPAIDKNENIYWMNYNQIYYKPAASQNYQEIYRRLECVIKIRGFDAKNNLICEITNNKPGEHEIWQIKSDGTKRLIVKGINADVSSSGEMLAFSRKENNTGKIYLKSLLNDTDEIYLGLGTKVQFAPDSASLRYFNDDEIIRRSLINDTPGEIISIFSNHFMNMDITICSADNKSLGGKGTAGIFVSPADKTAIRYLTGNPDDANPQFSQNDVLFLRDNRLMKIPINDGCIEKELFPGLHISSYKISNNNLIYSASGTIQKKDDYSIDVDVNNVVKAVEQVSECNAGEVIVEQITPENAAGIIARKYISNLQKEEWKNANRISQGMLGFFDDQTGKVYLIPQNIKKLANGINEKSFAEMVLAHEITHKMQYDLNNYFPCNFDAQLAWAAVTEGQAMVVADKVAIDMKIPADVVKKVNNFTKNAMPNKLSSNQQIAGQMTAEIYRAGKLFITWQGINNSYNKMWQIIKNPPLTTDTLYHPQNYPEKAGKVDYAYLLKDINKMFPGKMLMMNNAAIGTLAQRIIYNGMDDADKMALQEHIKAIQTAVLDNGDNTASVSVVILDNTKLTGRFIIAAEKIAIKNNHKLTVDTFVSGEIAGRKITTNNGKSLLFRILYNTSVIEISTNGIILTDDNAAKIMRQVIVRLKGK